MERAADAVSDHGGGQSASLYGGQRAVPTSSLIFLNRYTLSIAERHEPRPRFS